MWILLLLVTGPVPSAAQDSPARHELAASDRARIAEALRLANELGDSVWPGLAATPMPVLLVTDSAELLIARDKAGKFTSLGRDPLLDRLISARARQFPPTLLATFPINGIPTVVIGRAERTGRSSTEWVLTLLHEHFHQWQYGQPGYYDGVARLDLAGGDTTGTWMLNYPFPYDSAPVARAVRQWATALRNALNAPRLGSQELKEVVSARDALRSRLSAADYRYLEFQLWQEGVARFIEYRTARLASRQREPLPDFKALPDYQPYGIAATETRRDLLRELRLIDLERDRRVSFYPIGAAIALVLDEIRPGWKEAYSRRPFSLATLLSASPR